MLVFVVVSTDYDGRLRLSFVSVVVCGTVRVCLSLRALSCWSAASLWEDLKLGLPKV